MLEENQSPTPRPELTTLEINELVDAFSKAQGEFPKIPKDSEVEVKKEGRLLYTFKYADLTTIIDCVRPALTKYGLSFTQDYFKHPDLGVGIVTQLFHKSGQWIKTGFVPCAIKSQNMKEVAGVFTYGKRISLTAALGISADEDVDAAGVDADQGNQTTKKAQTKPPQKPKQQPAKKPPNLAPGSDPFPDYENEPQQPMSLLQQVVNMSKVKGVSPPHMKNLIKKCIGEEKLAKDLSQDELKSVLNYLKLK
jgi:hypothetical protein